MKMSPSIACSLILFLYAVGALAETSAPTRNRPMSASPSATLRSITSSEEKHIVEVCSPTNDTNQYDLSFPCSVFQLILLECQVGPDLGLLAFEISAGNKSSSDPGIPDKPKLMSPNTQRVCACESQFFDQMNGCAACYKAHGEKNPFAFMGEKGIASMSSAYCALSATPTVPLFDFVSEWVTGTAQPGFVASSTAAFGNSSYSDPLGTTTAVSMYYTPSATGTEAWQVPDMTNSAGATVLPPLVTSSGQIVATSRSSSSTSTGNAAPVVTGYATVAGVMGVIAAIAIV